MQSANDGSAYFDALVPILESALSEAVNDVLERQPEQPLAEICTALYEKHGHRQQRHNGRPSREQMLSAASSSGLLMMDANSDASAPKQKPERQLLPIDREPVFTGSRGLASELPAAIAVATSNHEGGSTHATGLAMREAARSLYEQLDGAADLVLCFCTEQHACADVERAARNSAGPRILAYHRACSLTIRPIRPALSQARSLVRSPLRRTRHTAGWSRSLAPHASTAPPAPPSSRTCPLAIPTRRSRRSAAVAAASTLPIMRAHSGSLPIIKAYSGSRSNLVPQALGHPRRGGRFRRGGRCRGRGG